MGILKIKENNIIAIHEDPNSKQLNLGNNPKYSNAAPPIKTTKTTKRIIDAVIETMFFLLFDKINSI